MKHQSSTHHMPASTLLRSYIIGFVLSLALTLAAFYAAYAHLPYARAFILVCAVAQMIVQLVCFLNVGAKHGERSYGITLLLAFTLIASMVGGTLWIMQNLAHLHMMNPTVDDLYEGGDVSPQHELK